MAEQHNNILVAINGQHFEAKPGQTIIQVADQNDVYIPRFCYHEKLSVVANCRMCLVEVAGVPKALPACATPVADGMVVQSQSPMALAAQRSVMAFLLVNHPLDCPVCDQGGACELQDLSMGFGHGKSSFSLPKRVVKDLDVGPLISTHMTRCIHCTRCVRFGEEVAGMRELGATGRGERMAIGTYVSKMVRSELSGNVIDLCPVGALTSKPFAFQARHWELRQHPGIANHDAVGSHVYWHTRGDAYHAGRTLMKVIPRHAPAVNANWLSDRDRFSYLGLASPDRLTLPEIKVNGEWRQVGWGEALTHAATGLTNILDQSGPGALGALASLQSTTEALYVLRSTFDALGSQHVDVRASQSDFSDDACQRTPGTDDALMLRVSQSDVIVMLGACVRQDQPLLNVRVRQAALSGAQVVALGVAPSHANHAMAWDVTVGMDEMIPALAYLVKSCVLEVPDAVVDYAKHASLNDGALYAMATLWRDAKRPVVVLGQDAYAHPQSAVLRQLLALWEATGRGDVLHLPMGSNWGGARLAGAMPNMHSDGDNAHAMFKQPKQAYVLLNHEPEWDHAKPAVALAALRKASEVICITPFASEAMRSYATVLLPSTALCEVDGSYVNLMGVSERVQSVPSEHTHLRHDWQILHALMQHLSVVPKVLASVEAIGEQMRAGNAAQPPQAKAASSWTWPKLTAKLSSMMLRCVLRTHMYQIDPMVRRAAPLQAQAKEAVSQVHLAEATVRRLGLMAGDLVHLESGGQHWEMPWALCEGLHEGSVLLYRQPECHGHLSSGDPLMLTRSQGNG